MNEIFSRTFYPKKKKLVVKEPDATKIN